MKKKIAILAAMLLLTGCGAGNSAPESSAADSESSAQTTLTTSEPGTVSEPPSTEPPSTEPPSTEPPSTEPPSTEPPSTEPSITEPELTAEPVPTVEATGEESAEKLPVKAQYIWEVPELGGHDEYGLNDNALTVEVVFTAESTVTDFKVLSISVQDYDDAGNFAFAAEEVYSQPELTPERPLVAGMEFLGDIPNNGISFTDADGNVKYYAVDMSGRDSSLFLLEISVV